MLELIYLNYQLLARNALCKLQIRGWTIEVRVKFENVNNKIDYVSRVLTFTILIINIKWSVS